MKEYFKNLNIIGIGFYSRPKIDKKIMNILREKYSEVHFAGDVSHNDTRIILIEDSNATVKNVVDLLNKYIEKGIVYSVTKI